MLVVLAWASAPASSQASSPAGYVVKTITLSRAGDTLVSPVITLATPFNVLGLKLGHVVRGMQVNFDPLNAGKWEPFEVHDDGFGPEALLFSRPATSVQFKKTLVEGDEQALEVKADIFFQEDSRLRGNDKGGANDRWGGIISSDLYAGPLVASNTPHLIRRSEWGADESLRVWNPEAHPETGSTRSGTPQEKETATAKGEVCGDFDSRFQSELGITRVVDQSPTGEPLLWPLQYAKSIRKIVIHHTDSEIRDIDGDNFINSRDYAAIVRAIYHFHTVTRGWGDIGYNTLIDPLGNVYEGRAGGDMVIGAHVLCHNNGALGIAIIGNYQDNDVPEPALQSAITLVAEKAREFHLDPMGSSSFRGQDLPNILGHRDVRPTACPGNKLYALLSKIRDRAGFLFRGGSFGENLSMGTLDYNADPASQVPPLHFLPNEHKTLTLSFRNTGAQTWNQDTWLYVDQNNNPNARLAPLIPEKKFVAANLQESSVPPGATGTFEVQIEAGYKGGDYALSVAPVLNGRYRVSRASLEIPFSIEPPRLDYEMVQSELPHDIIFQTQKINAWIELKNTGNVVWRNYGDHPIALGTENPRDHKSIFVTDPKARLGYLVNSEVAPGEVGRFALNLQVPTTVEKRVVERFPPVIEGVNWLPDKNLGFSATIKKPRHLAHVTRVNPPVTLLPGEMRKIEIELENQGDLPWDADTMGITVLGRGGIKAFKNRMTPDEPVKPKSSATFDFWVQAPYKAGSTSIFLESQYNHTPIRGGASRMLIAVPEPRLRAQMTDQGKREVTLQPGEVKELTVKFKNLGNTVWYKSGPYAMTLAPSHPQDRKSAMAYLPDWVSPFRAAKLEESEVRPGETGTFTFKVQSFVRGFHQEYFQPVIEQVGWLPNTLVRWDFTVTGERVQGATRDELSDARRNAQTAAVITKVQKDSPITAPLPVTPPPSPLTPPTTPAPSVIPAKAGIQQDQLFRVRLSVSGENTTFRSDQPYTVTDGNGALLLSANTGQTVTLTRTGSLLRVQLGDVIHDVSIIRFVPQSNGIMEIASWKRRFRGTLEVRLIGDAVAVINELPLEDYLKGLAEAGADDPLEKKKALAVLARTYARFYRLPENRKFPGMPYDGSDDPAVFQKYMGYDAETKFAEFVGAVSLTENEVVTYQGKLIKTPYFHQSDGRTRSAQEVWGWTNTPYLVSVPDPWCAGLTLSGHGVGLSGCGAKAQALEGKSYDDIIKYYYKGVQIEELSFGI